MLPYEVLSGYKGTCYWLNAFKSLAPVEYNLFSGWRNWDWEVPVY